MSPLRRLRGRAPGPREDHGITLVVAIMVMGVAITLTILVITVAITTANQSGRDRQRTVAIHAAEAGVDAAYAAIQSSGTTLPCAWPATGTSSVSSAPDQVTTRATINYFKADGSAVACPIAATTGPSAPTTAVVDGYGETNSLAGAAAATRRMQALINVKPIFGDSLNKAIFSDGTLAISNQTTLTGNDGPNADVYTNGNFACANNQSYAGSVYAQGNITVQGSCTVAGDLWARGSVSNTSGSNGSVGGRVISSTSTISLPSNFDVNGTLLAAGNISWGGCGSTGKCFANTAAATPPDLPFPILRGDAATLAEWTAEGYTVVNHTVCSTVKARIKDTYSKNGYKTLVKTPCAVNFSKDKNISLSNDLAIFAYGGFSSSQQVSFASSNSSIPRVLHWVVPADAVVSRPCSTPGVTTDNQFNFATEVNMLVYSPCNISFSNNADHLGQVIGGSKVNIDNQFSMQYREVPVYGIDPTSLPLLSYEIDVVYKRETR